MMPDQHPQSGAASHVQFAVELMAQCRANADRDPFGNPVLAAALAINRHVDSGELDPETLATLIRTLRDRAFAERAARLAAYVGGLDEDKAERALTTLAARIARPDPDDSPVPWASFRSSVERTRFAAVFTAHPTFANPPEIYAALAAAANGEPPPDFASHRPSKPTLAQEFEQASRAIAHGRDALDRLTHAILLEARKTWPDRWTQLTPRPIVLATWVGYDTDGRTDIGWWDTLRFRLVMKSLQLERLSRVLVKLRGAEPIRERIAAASAAVERQIEHCPSGADPEAAENFASVLVRHRDAALVSPAPLLPLFDQAIADADDPTRLELATARAGLVSHGMALAHTHVRLNSSQIHNAIRLQLGLDDPPADRSRRRVLLGALNAALEKVEPIPVDFGSLLAEQASASRLMMTVAQIVKHIDQDAPVRFLIAETETGFTLLAALWLARRFGIERNIEISPLFETADALEHGARVLEEALRSPHYVDYLRQTGRLALQFGYSDSGRYVGQLAASFLIERLKLRIAELLTRYGLTDVELILFDTHGESIGRGAHPGALADRLRYLSPDVARQGFARAGIGIREESSFQGGDGYLLFGTRLLALATISGIGRHALAATPTNTDAVYEEPDFAADFFASIGLSMHELVEDPGYAALLGAFGPALLDPTGSRPAARQSDTGGPVAIRHPRELRAIPNNAILQQLGWCANTLQGIGDAASRSPELFADMLERSPRFRRAMDFAEHALRHSDMDVLRAAVSLIDPGSWLDRAAHARRLGRRRALADIATALEGLGLWAPAQRMCRRIQADNVRLREAWAEAPSMSDAEMLLHALRVFLIGRIWLLAMDIPEFSPRHGTSRDAVIQRVLRLDVPGALKILEEVFPLAGNSFQDRDFAEPAGPRPLESYRREHDTCFQPMSRLFDLVREIGCAITHCVGAFG